MSWRIAVQTLPGPSLDLLFTNRSLVDNISGQNLITFTRASSATYVDSNRLIRTAAVNEPRFDHNPATGESLGLLIEEERTNLRTYSAAPNASNAYRIYGTPTYNSGVAPDGTATATLIAGNGATLQGFDNYSNDYGNSQDAIQTYSVHVKNVNATSIRINLIGSRTYTFTFATESGVAAGGTSGGFQKLSGGWYRIWMTVTKTNGFWFQSLDIDAGIATNASMFFWGVQLENAAFPTSYIPTTTAAVTRAADVASITGANFSSWYNNTESTLFCDFSLNADRNATRWAAQIGPTALTGPNSNVIGKVETNLVYAETRNNFVTQYSASRTFPSSRMAKIAYAIKNLDHQAAFDGVLSAAGTGTLGTPSNTVLFLGRNAASTEMLCGTISRLTYWPARLPNPILQTLTQ